MRVRQIRCCRLVTALALLLASISSCGSEAPYDWKNRKIGWTYAPTTGTSLPEHLSATGSRKGSAALAKGWQCQLSDGKKLTVTPFKLARSHAQFGKVKMIVGLFDKTGKQLETVRSEPLTAESAASSFELTEAVAKPLYDVVFWFVEA